MACSTDVLMNVRRLGGDDWAIFAPQRFFDQGVNACDPYPCERAQVCRPRQAGLVLRKTYAISHENTINFLFLFNRTPRALNRETLCIRPYFFYIVCSSIKTTNSKPVWEKV